MRRYGFVLLVLLSFTGLTPGVVAARIHFSIGVGATIGGCYPHYGWYSDWHWHPRICRPWHGCGYRPWCSPGVGLWVHGCSPIFVQAPTVVTKRHIVVNETASDCPAPTIEKAVDLSHLVGPRQSELLKRLRIGDRDNRIEAARELARFSCDDKVRNALERALLSDREAEVRQAAAESLNKLRDSKALPTLRLAYAEDPSQAVQQAAYRAIIMIEGY